MGDFYVNEVFLIGNIGTNIRTRDFDGGGRVTNFSLATKTSYRKADGTWTNKKYWHNISINNLSDHFLQFIQTGKRIGIKGSLKNREYEKEGKKITWFYVDAMSNGLIIIDGSEDSGEEGSHTNNQSESNSETNQEFIITDDMTDDDLPF